MITARRSGVPNRVTVVAAAGLAVFVCVAVALQAERDPAVMTLLGLATVASFGFLAWWSDPVWSFSGAVACSIFSGQWAYLGLASGAAPLQLGQGIQALCVP